MFPTKSRTDAGLGQRDFTESTRQMDGAWRLWESLTTWDTRFAWVVDTSVAISLFLCCSGWIFEVGPHHPDIGFVAALTIPLLVRRRAPFAVFFVISAIALVQLVSNAPLLADVSLLVALYTVAAVSEWMRVIVSFLMLQIGVIAATARWIPIRSYFESLVLLSGMAFAACLAGVVVRALRGQFSWLAERTRRLELERDQQASLAAATERARIAREMHDVISHNLQVMVTLADAAGVAQRHNSERGIEAMAEVANTGRQAMTDMRRMLGLLRDEAKKKSPNGPQRLEVIPPQPRIEELDALLERVRATGLPVELNREGEPFELSEAAELTAYRIVQEALTNALRHAESADDVHVTLTFSEPDLSLRVTDNGSTRTISVSEAFGAHRGGHGVPNMTERAAAFGGVLTAGPLAKGGWAVETTLHACNASVRT